MGHLTASQYGLRARVDAHERPLGQQTDRQRAMRAAFEVLKGTISATSAMSKYRVDRHSLRYYKTRLVKDGVAEIIASVPEVAPALVPTPSTADSEKENGSNPREWDNYCRASVQRRHGRQPSISSTASGPGLKSGCPVQQVRVLGLEEG